MILDLTLNEEQTAALQSRVDSYNATEPAEEQLTAEQYLTRIPMAQIDQWVATDFAAAVKRLGDAAASLSYADRLALIAQVEAQITPP